MLQPVCVQNTHVCMCAINIFRLHYLHISLQHLLFGVCRRVLGGWVGQETVDNKQHPRPRTAHRKRLAAHTQTDTHIHTACGSLSPWSVQTLGAHKSSNIYTDIYIYIYIYIYILYYILYIYAWEGQMLIFFFVNLP
jgi:hypothetical protein